MAPNFKYYAFISFSVSLSASSALYSLIVIASLSQVCKHIYNYISLTLTLLP